MSDAGVLLDFEYDGRPFTIGRPPNDPKPRPGQPSQAWTIRGDGCLLAVFQCSDEGLPAVLDERVAWLDRNRDDAVDPATPWSGMLATAASTVRAYLEMHTA